ncbi:peptidylprolyl isomerase [Bacteroidetes/Chlorobi group bacterium Naka2016]|jgi:cyclophilin family peptidyl-prolyl cis-trans isomerase|nr:MAG: peptidylprolyl isomerase [Bacteroidetes/Chlorobi group bacterium Naka2016]
MKFLFLPLMILLFVFGACNKSDREETQIPKRTIDTNDKNYREVVPVSRLKFDIQLNPDSVNVTHFATLKTTFGDIKIALFGEDAPKTVKNFVTLARQGYFNNTLIHRIAKNFLIQMGDGTTRYPSKKNEWGKGGKSIYGGYFQDEINPNSPIYRVGYTFGTVAMANSGPNKNLSQFFICLDEARDLDKKYTIFGKVVDGFDVINKIEDQEIIPFKFDSLDGTPKKPIVIFRVIVKENKKNSTRENN